MFGQVLDDKECLAVLPGFQDQNEIQVAANQSYFFKNFQCGRTRFFMLVLEMKRNRTENLPVYSNNLIVLLLRLNLLSPYQCSKFLFKVLPEKSWVHMVTVHLCSILSEEHGDCHEVVLKSKCN